MKKVLCIILISIISLCILANIFLRSNISDINNYDGVAMILDENKLSETGLTFMVQNETDKELTFDKAYSLERKIFGKWYKVLYKPTMLFQPVGWNSVGLIVKAQSTQTFDVNWEWLYGNLSRGKYRIVKKFITDYPATYHLSVEFSISKNVQESDNLTDVPTATAAPSSETLSPTATSSDAPSPEAPSPTDSLPAATSPGADSPAVSEYNKMIQLSMVSLDTGFALTDDYQVLKTTDGGQNWSEFYRIEVSGNSLGVYPEIYSVDADTVYVAAYFDARTNFVSVVDGKAQTATAIESVISWVKDDISGYELDFIDAKTGFLLISCTPGAGQMLKALYKTTDAGLSWDMLTGDGGAQDNNTEITPVGIGGFPNGMAFSTPEKGWTMCTSYGTYGIWLYRTDTGGKTWDMVDIPEIPQEFSEWPEEDLYLSASKPSFYGKDNRKGKLIMSFTTYVPERTNVDYVYSLSEDDILVPEGRCNTLIRDCKFIDDLNGIGLDNGNKVRKTEDGGFTWK